MHESGSRVSRWQRMALGCLAAIAGACAFETADRPDGPTDTPDQEVASSSTGLGTSGAQAAATCEDGVVTECRAELPSHNGVRTCFEGLRLCKDGRFGACRSAEEIEAELEETR